MVELGRGLIVPGTPGFTAIYRYHRSLISYKQHDVRLLGIDPNAVVVISTGSSFDGHPTATAIG